ncbi:MAG: thioredoxin domain-containing protein [Cellulosilyticaceae bacterium]
MIREVEGQEALALIQEGRVFVDFFSTTCGPCKMLNFVLADLQKEVEDVTIVKVDFDKNKELTAKYDVTSYPTMILFEAGEEVSRVKGLQQKPALKKILTKA